MGREAGFSVAELLVVVAVLAILAALSLGFQGEMLARLELEAATRRVVLGLERGRGQAERQGQPCALSLQSDGWGEAAAGDLPSCFQRDQEPSEGLRPPGSLRMEHNLPAAVRFSSNGLVLDGGTVVLTHPGTALRRCVVMSLPLGITRVGQASEAGCLPDPPS